MPARVQIGDIVEIETKVGFAYALFSHHHTHPPRYGALLRVFETLYEKPPMDFRAVVNDRVRFSTFFPLGPAVNRGLVKIVAHAEIPAALRDFPLFRSGTRKPGATKIETWWLWDGENSWRVGALTADQRFLPIRSTWNHAMLVGRIESGWRPENVM